MNILDDKRFCVYVYKDSCGEIFYVGSGTAERPKQKRGRTKEFNLKVQDNFSIDILHSELTKDESFSLEDEYLNRYFNHGINGWSLVNKRKTTCKIKPLTYEMCSQHWYYSEESPSKLKWKHDRIGHNGRCVVKAGDKAGSVNSSGYYNTNISKQAYAVHRIIWVLHNKKDIPNNLVINHIDSCRTNNNIDNLEAVTPRVNNIKRNHANPNMLNIHWHKRDKTWDVRWRENGKPKSSRFNPDKYGSTEAALLVAKEFRDNLRTVFYSFSPAGLN